MLKMLAAAIAAAVPCAGYAYEQQAGKMMTVQEAHHAVTNCAPNQNVKALQRSVQVQPKGIISAEEFNLSKTVAAGCSSVEALLHQKSLSTANRKTIAKTMTTIADAQAQLFNIWENPDTNNHKTYCNALRAAGAAVQNAKTSSQLKKAVAALDKMVKQLSAQTMPVALMLKTFKIVDEKDALKTSKTLAQNVSVIISKKKLTDTDKKAVASMMNALSGKLQDLFNLWDNNRYPDRVVTNDPFALSFKKAAQQLMSAKNTRQQKAAIAKISALVERVKAQIS
jgi:hypothetical protein